MKSKTLSKVTWYVFLWTVAAVALATNKEGFNLLTKFISTKQTNFFVGIPLFCLFFLIAMRVISYFAINDSHKGISISSLEFTYRTNYFLLTVEAKKVLQDCIAAEQDRLNKKLN